MTNDSTVLSAQNISKFFNQKTILDNISMHINKGEIIGLLGPNGAGKSTLFNILIGLIKPDIGNIVLNGVDIVTLPIHMRSRLGIGYLPQDSSIFPTLSAEDNIRIILEIIYSDKKIIELRLNSLLDEFTIAHVRKKSAILLSGGQKRRLEIARTIASDPLFIMLDEPFAGIDPIAIRDIKSLLQQLKQRNIGIVISDHNVRDTLDIVDRSYIIYEGKVLSSGTKEEILKSQDVRTKYIGNSMHS